MNGHEVIIFKTEKALDGMNDIEFLTEDVSVAGLIPLLNQALLLARSRSLIPVAFRAHGPQVVLEGNPHRFTLEIDDPRHPKLIAGPSVAIFKTDEALQAAVRSIFEAAKAALGFPDWREWTAADRAAIQAKVNEIAKDRIGREIILEWK